MTDILRCCPAQSLNQPYIGVQQKCCLPAIFCIQHQPHKNSQGLLHQMLPLKQFKRTLQQKKFLMNQKVSLLNDQYNLLMDSLIQQIKQLKLRKNIQLTMLWLRQLARDQQQYQLMRQIYRMDFTNITCGQIHRIYFKIVHNQILEKKKINQIQCYKGISLILEHLTKHKQIKSFLAKKIAEIEGVMENGEILKRTLPQKVIYKEHIKQVLLQSPYERQVQIKYNKSKLLSASRQYLSIFSKYPILPHITYHLNITTKYTNVMIGICTQQVKSINSKTSNNNSIQYDNHYNKNSLVFNCTNGCIYLDGMFSSNNNSFTKDIKNLQLKLRLTSMNQLIIMFGKNVLCREKINNQMENKNDKLYLHVLMRNQGDKLEVDREKEILRNGMGVMQFNQSKDNNEKDQQQHVDYEEIKRRNQQEDINIEQLKNQIIKNNNIQTIHIQNPKPQEIFQEIIKKSENIKNINNYEISSARATQLMKIQQRQKQLKINQIIKRQRIQKILNDIKSKIQPTKQLQLPKKIKQVQQNRLNQPKSNASLSFKSTDSLQKIMLQQKLHSNILLNRKSNDNTLSPLTKNHISGFNQQSSVYLKTDEINPLLIIKRPTEMISGFTKQVSSQLEENVQSHDSKELFESKMKYGQSNKSKAYQKSYQFYSQQSFNFDAINSTQNFNNQVNKGQQTPINKIQQFQFLKKNQPKQVNHLNKSSLIVSRFASNSQLAASRFTSNLTPARSNQQIESHHQDLIKDLSQQQSQVLQSYQLQQSNLTESLIKKKKRFIYQNQSPFNQYHNDQNYSNYTPKSNNNGSKRKSDDIEYVINVHSGKKRLPSEKDNSTIRSVEYVDQHLQQ